MPALRFSSRAESDLTGITRYTLRSWGQAQTVRYLDELEICCQTLAANPALGRPCDYIRPGPRRFEHGSHVILYRHHHDGILISRILHQRMLPQRHPVDDQDS